MSKIYYSLFVNISCLVLLFSNCEAQWQADTRLTNNPAGSYTSWNNARCVAASGDLVVVVWYDDRDGNNEIYFKTSSNSGVSWGPDTRLTYNTANSKNPSVAVTGEVICVAWEDTRNTGGNEDIYFARSINSGVQWEAAVKFTNSNVLSRSLRPSVSADGQRVTTAWYDSRDGNDEIYCKRSTNAGYTWLGNQRLTNNTAWSRNPSIALYYASAFIVWHDFRNGYADVFYKRSVDGGVSWSDDTPLVTGTYYSEYPSVSISGGLVTVVWKDDRINAAGEIYFKRSTDLGINWGPDAQLTGGSGYSIEPSVLISGVYVHVLWNNFNYMENNFDIYYKRSTDRGVSWETNARLTNNTALSDFPSMAVSGHRVHVVWFDQRNGNPEIYYKTNPTGNPIGIKNINSEVPSGFLLFQNYPNPFNPLTKIRFEIPPAGDAYMRPIQLKIFDNTGKEAAVLVNEYLKPGIYEAEWDASGCSSGVYYYSIAAGDFSDTKKMILIK